MEEKKSNTIQDLSLQFSIHLMKYEANITTKKSIIHMNQLIRSGTSIGAMVREAQGAESRKDFIHKMKIAFKEAEEAEYWLILTGIAYPSAEVEDLKDFVIQIKKILSRIISTSILKMIKQ